MFADADDDWGFYPEIRVADISGSTVSNIHFFDIGTAQPAWAPHGNSIAYITCETAGPLSCDAGHVTVAGIDGSDARIIANSRGLSRPAWSPGSKMIVYANTCMDYNCPSAILYASVDGSQRGVRIDDAHSPSLHK